MKFSSMGCRVSGFAVALCGVAFTGECVAGALQKGESAIVGPDDPAESWLVSKGAQLWLTPGSSAGDIDVNGGVLDMRGATATLRHIGFMSTAGQLNIENSRIDGNGRVGIRLEGHTRGQASQLTLRDSVVQGRFAGITVDSDSNVLATSTKITADAPGDLGILLAWGRVRLEEGSEVLGGTSGVFMGTARRLSDGGPTELVVSASKVHAIDGAAVQVGDSSKGVAAARVSLEDGATLSSQHGPAVAVAEGAHIDLRAAASSVLGDVQLSQGATASVSLSEGALLRGAVAGAARVAVGSGAQWSLTGDSQIEHLRIDGGLVAFDEGAPIGVLKVAKGMSGGGGNLRLRVDASTLGAGTASINDQVLVQGDVETSRPIGLSTVLTGSPTVTDVNGNHVADSNEGASLVQVGGSAGKDTFRLDGDYVALGAYQYELKAFGPGEVDPEQNRLGETPLNWDYRLVSRQVSPGEGSKEVRPAVAPQVASYISAPGAVFAYADGLSTSLHDRLGEIRDHAFEGSVGGEIFARYSGKNERFSSGRSFTDYGYDFDESTEAWQFGGSLVGLDGDNGSLRAGWAIDRGRSSVVPRAVDGESVTRLRANGTSAWVTWRSGGGFWMDWVVGHQRMRGQTDTSLSGRGVGKIRASSTGVSLGAGMPFQLSHAWSIEPHMLLSTQSVRINPITEDDGLKVTFRGRRYVTRSAGVSVLHQGQVFTPFARLDLRSTTGSAVIVTGTKDATSTSRFAAGRAGEEFLVSGGVTAQLTPRLQAFGDGTYRHYVGAGGFQGWSGNIGLRLTF